MKKNNFIIVLLHSTYILGMSLEQEIPLLEEGNKTNQLFELKKSVNKINTSEFCALLEDPKSLSSDQEREELFQFITRKINKTKKRKKIASHAIIASLLLSIYNLPFVIYHAFWPATCDEMKQKKTIDLNLTSLGIISSIELAAFSYSIKHQMNTDIHELKKGLD